MGLIVNPTKSVDRGGSWAHTINIAQYVGTFRPVFSHRPHTVHEDSQLEPKAVLLSESPGSGVADIAATAARLSDRSAN
jgi:hypothetical protein